MANCSYTIDGKTYSKSELKAWLYDGGLEQLYPEGMPGVDGKSVKDSYEQKEADRYAKERYNMLTQGLSEKDVTAHWKNQEKIFRDRAKVLRDKAKLLKERGDKVGAIKVETEYKDALREANANKQRAVEPKQDAKFSKSQQESISDFSDRIKAELGLKQFHVFEDSSGNIELSTIIVAKAEQGKGKGTEALSSLIKYADSVGKTIVLTPGLPNDNHGTTSRARLVKFYKRFGFVESKGRNIDYAIGGGKMYRHPQTKFSKSQSTTGSTIAQVTSWLPKRVGKMLETGKLVVVQDINSLPTELKPTGEAMSNALGEIETSGVQNFADVGNSFIDAVSNLLSSESLLKQSDNFFNSIGSFLPSSSSKNPDIIKRTLNDMIGESGFLGYLSKGQAGIEEQNKLINGILDLFRPNNPSYLERPSDRSMLYSKFFSDLGDFDSFIQHGFSLLNVPSKLVVKEMMLLLSHDSKVLNSIVEFVPVNVVNMLKTGKFTPNALLNNMSMLKNVGAINSNHFVPISANMTGSSASQGAKKLSFALGNTRGNSVNFSAASGTLNDRHDVTPNSNVMLDKSDALTSGLSPIISNLSNVQALYDSKSDTIYLVASALNKDTLNPVLAHELFHRMESTDKKLQSAIEKFDSDLSRRFELAKKGIGSKAEKDAADRVISAGTPVNDQLSEFKAYLVEAYQTAPETISATIRKAIFDFIAAIRVALIKSGLDMGFIKSLTPADLMAMSSMYGAKAGKADSQGGIKASTKTLPEKITIDGVERWTVNSDGKPIAQDEAGIRNFWKFFGDSKVVDEQGRPLVVYHGARKAGFSVFNVDGKGKTQGIGAWFTETKEGASTYSNTRREADVSSSVKNGNYSVYLNLKNPMIVDADGNHWSDVGGETFWWTADENYEPVEEFDNEADAIKAAESSGKALTVEKGIKPGTEIGTDELAKRAKANGYDGVIFENIDDHGIYERKSATNKKTFVAFNPTQIKSATGNTGAFDSTNPDIRYSIASKTQTLLKDKQSKFDTAIYQLQDRYIDLKRQIEKVVKHGGKITANPYQAEELSHQRIASRIKDFIEKELTPILQGLHDNGISLDDFQKFLHARHAESRNAVMAERNPSQAVIDAKLAEAEAALDALDGSDKKAMREAQKEVRKWRKAKPFKGTEEERLSLSGMSNQEARDFIAGLPADKAKAMNTLGDKIDRITNKTLDLLVSYGMETQETVDALKAQWEHYVPLHRDEAHPDNNGQPIGKGFSVRGSGLKTATGSNAEVTNILAHLAAQREQMIRRGEKNRVSNILADFIKLHPDDEFATVDKVEMQDSLNDDGLVESRMEPFFKRAMKDNVIMFRKDGKDHAITFNDRREDTLRLAMSLKNMAAGLDAVESVFAKGTRWMASINTQYNIVFGLFNLLRDTQGMMLNMTTTPLAGRQKQVFSHLWDSMKIIYQSEQGLKNMDPTLKAQYDAFNKAGGTTGYSQMFDDIRSRNKSLEEQLKDMSAGKGKKLWNAAKQWVTDYNTVMENATRLSVFIEAKNQGLSDDEAASIAKNITVNFNRKGIYTTKVGALYAFFNASMQGTARLAETMKGPKGKQIMAGGVLAGALSTILGLMVMGDDEWEKIPEFERERNLIIATSKTGYAKIAMPLGLHILPNIGRKVIEMMAGSSKVSAQQRLFELAAATAGAFNPLGSGDLIQLASFTVTDPIIDLARNKDWTGKTIYREDLNSLNPTPGFTRTKDTATSGAKVAAYAINKLTGGTEAKQGFWSPTPDQIDYLLGQITGGTGREISKAWQAAESVFTGEELPAYKRPLLGRLYGETKGNAAERSAYYDNVKRLNEHEAEIKWLRENKQAAKVSEYLRENPEAKLVLKANGIENAIKKLKSTRSKLEGMGVGKERLNAIDTQIVAHMKRLNDAVSSVND